MATNNDSVAACKAKLSHFRVKELKDVLTQVGLSKQGKKQDLTDRIFTLLDDDGSSVLLKNIEKGKEGLLAIIDTTYRIMQEAVSNDSSTKKHYGSSSSRLRPKQEADESCRLLRCPCGRGSELPSCTPQIQCVDPDCNVWQHTSCVIIPERPMDIISIPSPFLCEICRVKRADPFWDVIAYPLNPVKLVPSSIPIDGTNPHVNVEKTFNLTKVDRDLLRKNEYCVQVWCMLLNDPVPFRIHWPQYADLQINGNPLKTVNRPASQQLGANGRDDGANITACTVEGVNKISLSFTDARNFCFGVRLLRRRTLEQVFGIIPKETDGEPFDVALARIQRCIGGGVVDTDLEMIADSVPVSLRCPMSGSRMKIAGRFRPCAHMGCFDLHTFVEITERTRKWQCPICLKNYSLEDIVVDPFFNNILKKMGSCEEELHEIDLKTDGSWRVKKAREAGDLAKWHRLDGSIKEYSPGCNTSKQEMKNNVVDIPQHTCPSLLKQGHDGDENFHLDIITMSSTTTGNGDGQLEVSSNEPEVSSVLNRFGRNHGINEQHLGFPDKDADIIVLSDSDDDDVTLVGPPNHDGKYASPLKDVKFFRADATLVPFPCSLGLQERGSGYLGISGVLTDNDNCATCTGYNNSNISFETTMDPVSHANYSSALQSSDFNHQIPSFDGGFPLEVALCPSVLTDDLSLVNKSNVEHWNILTAGGNGHESSSSNVDAHHESPCEILVDLQDQNRSIEGSFIQTTDGDSGSGSGSGSDLAVKRKRSDGPFSFPRQQRSPRRRSLRAVSSSTLLK